LPYVSTRANHTQPDRLLRSLDRRREWYSSCYFTIRIVIEQHAQVRLGGLSRDQRVGAFSVFDTKAMRRQPFNVDAFPGDEFEKAFDVSFSVQRT
jgi:hypothetical protein